MLFNYDPLDLLGFGFVLGFVVVLITFLILHITGKKVPAIKRGILIVGSFLIIIYTPSIQSVSKIWLLLSLLIFALILNNIINIIYNISSNLYDKYLPQNKLKIINQIIYLSALLFGLGLIASGSANASIFVYNLIKQLILLCTGIWLALKLLYTKEDNHHEKHH